MNGEPIGVAGVGSFLSIRCMGADQEAHFEVRQLIEVLTYRGGDVLLTLRLPV